MKTASPFAPGRVHFIGIGGIGMSALAQVLHQRGSLVSGSDAGRSAPLEHLEALGISFSLGHAEEHLPEGVDCVIATAAVREGNPELEEATRRGVKVYSYAEALSLLAQDFTTTAVAGTHGKTTTAAMLAWILLQAGKEPAAVIGGLVPQLRGNALFGQGGAMVVEACEFNRSFLALKPHHGIITNMGDDHLDYYGSSDQLRAAFRQFAGRVSRDGILVTQALVARDLDLRGVVKGRLVTIGAKRRDVRLLDGGDTFRISFPDGAETPPVRMVMPGHHNALNATAAAVVAHLASGVALEEIASALETFEGVERRFRVLREDRDVTVIDDYAHHPDEIEATLLTVRHRYPGRRIVTVFQPHLAARVKRHFSSFLNALAYGDDLVLVRDYKVVGRDEMERDGARRLRQALAQLGVPHHFSPDLNHAVQTVRGLFKPGDVICVMGAGDVGEVSLELAQSL